MELVQMASIDSDGEQRRKGGQMIHRADGMGLRCLGGRSCGGKTWAESEAYSYCSQSI